MEVIPCPVTGLDELVWSQKTGAGSEPKYLALLLTAPAAGCLLCHFQTSVAFLIHLHVVWCAPNLTAITLCVS